MMPQMNGYDFLRAHRKEATTPVPGPLTDLTRMPTGAAVEQGLDVVGDFNDRYAYNEQLAYYTSPAVAQVIIQRSLASVEEMVAWLAAA
jgi:CheY-like chemotaxis protein